MNSLVSSASFVLVRIVVDVRWRNSASARSPATGSSAPMIWGSERSSSRAWPSAIRSGQNATSTLSPRSSKAAVTYSVVPGIHGAAQDDERTIRDVRRDLVHRPLEHAHGWAQELVHGRADHQDHGVRAGHHRGGRVHLEAAGGEDAGKQLVRAVLQERHVTRRRCAPGRHRRCRRCPPAGRLRQGRGSAAGRRGPRHRGRRRRAGRVVRTAGPVATVSVMRCTLATPAARGGLPEGTSGTALIGHRARTRIVPSASSQARSHGPDGIASPAGTTTTSAAQRSSTSPASGPCSAA